MNVSLTSILSRNTAGTNQADAANAASVLHGARNAQTAAVLDTLLPGQTLSGAVRSVSGANILLDIGGGMEISAKLEGGIDITAGKSMLFEVKSNAAGKLNLSPLYTNLSTEGNAGASALRAAGLPLSGTNMSMVGTMMEEGMPIDKNSLWTMNRLVTTNNQTDAAVIVKMVSMGLEINEANLQQFEAAQNMQNHLLYTVEDMLSGMDSLLEGYAQEGNFQAGNAFMEGLLAALGEDAISQALSAQENQTIAQLVSGEITAEQLLGEGAGAAAGEQADAMAAAQAEEASGQAFGGNLLEELAAFDRALSAGEQSGLPSSGTEMNGAAAAANAAEEHVAAAEMQKDTELPGNAANEAPLTSKLLLEEQNDADRFRLLARAFSSAVKDALSREWTIRGEDFAGKDTVKAFYQKVAEQASRLQEHFAQTGTLQTDAGRAVSSLNNNLQFMENVNQFYPYLQIPLKASLQSAHGELYVYAGKRHEPSEDGSVSALLHLEMSNLGNMDIHVRMKDRRVATNFMLEKEETLDFLADHMHILTERLERRGYHMEFSMTEKQPGEKEETVIDRIRGEKKDGGAISYTSFDVRA